MLEELYVENLGIIRSARIEPGPGLVAITGETGAGKTLLLGALRLLRGDTARTDRIGPHGREARAEGRFTIGEHEVVVARRMADGRSRAYVDGDMVPARVLAERLDALVEIVSQHEHLALGREASVRRLVDGMLDRAGVETWEAYRLAWGELTRLREERTALGDGGEGLEHEIVTLQDQVAEIERAGIEPGEDEALRGHLARLRSSGEIAAALDATTAALDTEGGAADALRAAARHLAAATRLDADLTGLAERLDGVIVEVEDALVDLHRRVAAIDHDPRSLEAAEERLALLGDLKRKYATTVDGLIEAGRVAAARVEALTDLLERSRRSDESIGLRERECEELGEALAAARRAAGKDLGETATDHLRRLGLTDPVLEVLVEPAAPGPHGADRVRLLFASDSGLQPAPVSRVASGGELSRLVLAVRVAAGVADADVVAFDEIDAGVGGATALAMAELLARLSMGRQVLVVTHLPQVAAFADAHFAVERSGAEATVRAVEGEERRGEISRMLSGLGDSEAGRDHASELLALAAERRERR